MSAKKTRTALLMTHYATFLRVWFRNYATAQRELKLMDIPGDNFWRMLRFEPSRQEHVDALTAAMEKYAREHPDVYGANEILGTKREAKVHIKKGSKQ